MATKRDTIEGRRADWARDQQKTRASRKDSTWDGIQHTCCGSKRGIRHKVTCKNAPCNYVDDLSDLKDIEEECQCACHFIDTKGCSCKCNKNL